MADASKKGWQALDSAASVLKEGWLGNRAEEFDDQYEALVSQAEKILKHLDEISRTMSRRISLKSRQTPQGSPASTDRSTHERQARVRQRAYGQHIQDSDRVCRSSRRGSAQGLSRGRQV
ncbi:hypothetical protein P5V39_00925 [Mycobacteroides abscessus subsp. abscessus]|nr:hypothetical protein [Mycobacteroides abscessus subsp. abscessus]